jgi:O-methyltransferase
MDRVRGYTLTTPANIAALCDSIRYLVEHRVPGAIVECGVWRGGSMMAAALTLARRGDTERDIYLFDTFAGPPPESVEDSASPYASASRTRSLLRRASGAEPYLPGRTNEEEVRRALEGTGYPRERIHLVPGAVEDTLPSGAPEHIALLRLDTDLYSSTRHELEHLYPRLAEGGVLIIDDYGHYPGARRAVDEYFAANGERVLLGRIDYSARLVVKQGSSGR